MLRSDANASRESSDGGADERREVHRTNAGSFSMATTIEGMDGKTAECPQARSVPGQAQKEVFLYRGLESQS